MGEITHTAKISMGKFTLGQMSLLSRNINMIDTSNLERFLMQEADRDIFIEICDCFLPTVMVEGLR